MKILYNIKLTFFIFLIASNYSIKSFDELSLTIVPQQIDKSTINNKNFLTDLVAIYTV